MSTIMKYRGYFAKVEFCEEDEILLGTVLGTRDLIMFQCESLKKKDVEESFHTAIDDYLSMCEEIGHKPDKSYSGSFNVRVNVKTHRRASLFAEIKGVSLNKIIENAIEKYLSEEGEENE